MFEDFLDEGVAFEIGYARALGIFCIGFKSDDRSMLPTGDNPMIERGCHRHCSTVDDLIGAIRSLIESILKRNFERGVSATKQPDGDKVSPIAALSDWLHPLVPKRTTRSDQC